MRVLADSATRVPRNTSPEVNRRIRAETTERLTAIGTDRRVIRARLPELDREWDIERAIEANASSIALTGTVLGLTVHRWFFALPLAVTAFLLQHSLQGWCPPVPPLRRLGFRTPREIEEERHELLARLRRAPGRPVAARAARGPRRTASRRPRKAAPSGGSRRGDSART